MLHGGPAVVGGELADQIKGLEGLAVPAGGPQVTHLPFHRGDLLGGRGQLAGESGCFKSPQLILDGPDLAHKPFVAVQRHLHVSGCGPGLIHALTQCGQLFCCHLRGHLAGLPDGLGVLLGEILL